MSTEEKDAVAATSSGSYASGINSTPLRQQQQEQQLSPALYDYQAFCNMSNAELMQQYRINNSSSAGNNDDATASAFASASAATFSTRRSGGRYNRNSSESRNDDDSNDNNDHGSTCRSLSSRQRAFEMYGDRHALLDPLLAHVDDEYEYLEDVVEEDAVESYEYMGAQQEADTHSPFSRQDHRQIWHDSEEDVHDAADTVDDDDDLEASRVRFLLLEHGDEEINSPFITLQKPDTPSCRGGTTPSHDDEGNNGVIYGRQEEEERPTNRRSFDDSDYEEHNGDEKQEQERAVVVIPEVDYLRVPHELDEPFMAEHDWEDIERYYIEEWRKMNQSSSSSSEASSCSRRPRRAEKEADEHESCQHAQEEEHTLYGDEAQEEGEEEDPSSLMPQTRPPRPTYTDILDVDEIDYSNAAMPDDDEDSERFTNDAASVCVANDVEEDEQQAEVEDETGVDETASRALSSASSFASATAVDDDASTMENEDELSPRVLPPPIPIPYSTQRSPQQSTTAASKEDDENGANDDKRASHAPSIVDANGSIIAVKRVETNGWKRICPPASFPARSSSAASYSSSPKEHEKNERDIVLNASTAVVVPSSSFLCSAPKFSLRLELLEKWKQEEKEQVEDAQRGEQQQQQQQCASLPLSGSHDSDNRDSERKSPILNAGKEALGVVVDVEEGPAHPLQSPSNHLCAVARRSASIAHTPRVRHDSSLCFDAPQPLLQQEGGEGRR